MRLIRLLPDIETFWITTSLTKLRDLRMFLNPALERHYVRSHSNTLLIAAQLDNTIINVNIIQAYLSRQHDQGST